jgi:hypothetical protein
MEPDVSPGGHLVTTLAGCAAAAVAAREAPAGDVLALVAGIAAGGFLIDVDHVIDYVTIERQRDLRPGAFLRYYVEGRYRKTFLLLHSYELFAVLGLVAWHVGHPALWGYLLGALMHLALDITFNGEPTAPKSMAVFYSFAYRLAHRFDAAALLGTQTRVVTFRFWTAFFQGG